MPALSRMQKAAVVVMGLGVLVVGPFVEYLKDVLPGHEGDAVITWAPMFFVLKNKT